MKRRRLTEDETFALEARAQRIAEEQFDAEEMAADMGISEEDAFAGAYEGILMELIDAAERGARDPYAEEEDGAPAPPVDPRTLVRNLRGRSE